MSEVPLYGNLSGEQAALAWSRTAASVQGGRYVIRKEAWSFYRTSSGVRLCWELEKPKGPKGGFTHPHP